MSLTEPVKAACSKCSYGVMDERAKQVICHRFPPTPVLMQVENPNAIQTPGTPTHALVNQALPPTVNPDWWCGEFKLKAGGVVV